MADGQTTPGARRAVVVLGMHRSGTSLLARALSALGPMQPADLMPPRPDNPAGFWEPLGVCRLNERILARLDSAWDRPGPWYVAGSTPQSAREALADWLVEQFLERAVECLAASYPGSGDFVLKEPRLCLFAPLWDAAIRRSGAEPTYVLAVRHPCAVAKSLKARNGLPARQSYRLWEAYLLGALDVAPAMPVLEYDDFIARPLERLTELAETLGLPIPAALAETLAEIVDPALVHHRIGLDPIATAPRMPRLVRDSWTEVQRWSADRRADRGNVAAGLQARYDDGMLLTGSGKVVPELRERATRSSG